MHKDAPLRLIVFDVEGTLFDFGKAYPHLLECLERIKNAGILMAIATSMGSRSLQHLLEQYEISDYFLSLQTPDNAASKPHPQMLYNILDATGVAAKNTLMIGDMPQDGLMAAAAGIPFIGVKWSDANLRQLDQIGALYLADDLKTLPDILAAHWGGDVF